jgi:hypothetical protein
MTTSNPASSNTPASNAPASLAVLVIAWLLVGLPLLWGVIMTLRKALALFA